MGTRYRIEYRDGPAELVGNARAANGMGVTKKIEWGGKLVNVIDTGGRAHLDPLYDHDDPDRWLIYDHQLGSYIDGFETFGEAEAALSALTTKAA